MTLGQIMGESGDHGQLPTHAHIMLVGGVLSITWGVLYKLLDLPARLIGLIQAAAHHIGVGVMIVSLYSLYGGEGDPASLGKILAIAETSVMLSVLLMLFLVVRAKD
ncbi:TonB-dependent receptor [Maricaulis sp.]|uniref:TonB-dependent receptor n=1 Tax=Maricaulis sp. TaxID=1486257 RepID=UPI003A9319F6